MTHISSRDTPQLKAWRRLAQDSPAYRPAGRFWLAGDHLCRAALQAHGPADCHRMTFAPVARSVR